MGDNLTNKTAAFEYVLYKLNEWYSEKNPDKKETGENDLSILKVMKLLFFVSGVDKNTHLFGTFNRFQAWQYGHVEADLYNVYAKKDGEFKHLTISRNNTKITTPPELTLNNNLKTSIDKNIKKLKEKNEELINYKASRLVNLSHAHYSWDIYHNRLNQPYTDMDIHIITDEPKYYK